MSAGTPGHRRWDPAAVAAALDADGRALVPGAWTADEVAALAALDTAGDAGFRKRVVMEHHGFGRGMYRYFAHPLPPLVADAREAWYADLAPIAVAWARRRGEPDDLPPDLGGWSERCRIAGQVEPTPLLLRYGPGDENRLHQDLYGSVVFPLQVISLLDRPGIDFTGGELVLTEQCPRQQSRVTVVPLGCGDAVVIPVAGRPVAGSSGRWHTVTTRHGVSCIRSGRRRTLGLVFHDAP
jgi:hypothetical protein